VSGDRIFLTSEHNRAETEFFKVLVISEAKAEEGKNGIFWKLNFFFFSEIEILIWRDEKRLSKKMYPKECS
jgi:hypothetical protein